MGASWPDNCGKAVNESHLSLTWNIVDTVVRLVFAAGDEWAPRAAAVRAVRLDSKMRRQPDGCDAIANLTECLLM
jgi:hypothetical protein